MTDEIINGIESQPVKDSEPGAADMDQRAEAPAFTIILAQRESLAGLDQALASIQRQEYPSAKIEVIVVVCAQAGAVEGILSNYKNSIASLNVINVESNDLASGLNKAVAKSGADYIMIIEASLRLMSDHVFTDCADTFKRTGANCLCRSDVEIPDGLNLFEQAVEQARLSFMGQSLSAIHAPSAEVECDPLSLGMVWRREVFKKVGEFDSKMSPYELADFNYRLKITGLKSFLAPGLKTFFQPWSSLGLIWKSLLKGGRGRFRFFRKNGISDSRLVIAPALIVAFIVLLIIGPPLGYPFLGWLQFIASIYFAAIMIVSALIAYKKGNVEYFLSLPVIFVVRHVALGFGFVREWLDTVRVRAPQTAPPSSPERPGSAAAPPAPPAPPATPASPASPAPPSSSG